MNLTIPDEILQAAQFFSFPRAGVGMQLGRASVQAKRKPTIPQFNDCGGFHSTHPTLAALSNQLHFYPIF
ncbi:hypothetical protein QUF54_10550 [Candidatus Marithioploca araucensis]|uniref:Uncharacterized protein n=1 Tax=Candidatus Marithioploca araucensis TaxID=70273 RepID=A0ABT7VW22_9GAMM|nr:hypothetical protein [Candidatus Marithioploca araucensis]